MKNSIKYLLLSAAALAAVSCESWLDVTPPSEIRAEDHYSSAEGFQQTLIGCYLAMGETDLYGENLTWHMVEMLGRQYDARKNTAADDYDLDRYNYKTTKSTEVIEKVWEKSYSVIANVNDALDHIDRRKDELDSVNYRIIKGELLAVRAYIHFDLIRLFGCSDLAGRTDLESRHTVPYLTSVDKDAAPQLTYAETLRRMIADLTEAARLLEIDPIRARYPESIYTEANVDKFYDYRYMHLNYFAVKALLARVCMWEGSDENKHTALLAALEVIDDPASVGIAGGLTLRTFTDSAKAPTNRDVLPERTYLRARRHGHGQEDRKQPQPRIFGTGPPVPHAVHQELGRRRSFRNQGRRHLRLPLQTALPQHQLLARGDKTPSKLYQQTSTGADYRHKDLMPLIRLPEMYYIAAECRISGPDKDLGEARSLLQEVRKARAVYEELDADLDEAGLMAQLEKEYRKEFICEGVVFYFYKRLGYEKLPRQSDVMSGSKAHRRRRLHAALPRFRNTVGTRTVSRTINC